MTVRITLNLTKKELAALRDDCRINQVQRYEVNGVNLHPVWKQMGKQLVKKVGS